MFKRSKAAVFIAVALAASAQDLGHRIADDLRSGNFAEAQQLLTEALKQSPRDPRVWTLSGVAMARQGRTAEALTAFRTALSYAPDYIPALESAARIEYDKGDPEAYAHVRRLVQLRPGDPDAHRMLAAMEFAHGDCAAGHAEALKAGSLGDTGDREYGTCLIRDKQFDAAITLFDGLAKASPGDAKKRYDAALVRFLAHRYDAVIAELGTSLDRLDADSLDLLGESYAATNRPDIAIKVLARAIVADPSDPERYVHFADACLPAKQFAAALETLNAGIATHPESAPLYMTRGIVHAEMARYEEADADFARAEQLDPSGGSTASAKGLVDLQRNDLGKAEREARERLRQHPNNAMLHYILAETILREGATPGSPEFAEAMRSARQAVAEQPGLAIAHDLMSRLYLQSGKTAEAVEESRTGMRLNPHDPTAVYHLILALRKAGRTAEVPALLKQLAMMRQQADVQRSERGDSRLLKETAGR